MKCLKCFILSLLLICSLVVSAENFNPFESPQLQTQGFTSPFALETPVLETPVWPENASTNNNLQGPILYGPGGDPIGGLPVSDAWSVFFILIGTYMLIKLKWPHVVQKCK